LSPLYPISPPSSRINPLYPVPLFVVCLLIEWDTPFLSFQTVSAFLVLGRRFSFSLTGFLVFLFFFFFFFFNALVHNPLFTQASRVFCVKDSCLFSSAGNGFLLFLTPYLLAVLFSLPPRFLRHFCPCLWLKLLWTLRIRWRTCSPFSDCLFPRPSVSLLKVSYSCFFFLLSKLRRPLRGVLFSLFFPCCRSAAGFQDFFFSSFFDCLFFSLCSSYFTYLPFFFPSQNPPFLCSLVPR